MRFFGHQVYLPIAVLAVTEFVCAAGALLMARQILVLANLQVEGSPRSLLPAMVFAAAVVLGVTPMGLYQGRQRLKMEGVAVRLLVGLGLAAIIVSVFNFVVPIRIGGVLWGATFALEAALLVAGRLVFRRLVDYEAFRRNVIIYGAGERAAALLKLRRRSDQRGFRIVAFIPAAGDRQRLEDNRVILPGTDLLNYAKAHQVGEVIVAMDDRRQGFPIQDLLACRFAGIKVLDLLTFLERETGKLNVDLVNPSWLIFSDGFSAKTTRELASRLLDLTAGAALLLLSSPIMLAAALAVGLHDGFPILYRQQRVGLAGKRFTLYKFRSMVKDAEADGRARWAGKDDSRVTRVGAILRKLRIDELPQLLNVMRGDMSLVGPRPERPEFVGSLATRIPYYHERHCVRPGITGWAQLCYPYGSSEEDALEKLQYDLYYVKHRSLIFNLMVLLQTAEVVFWGKGAR